MRQSLARCRAEFPGAWHYARRGIRGRCQGRILAHERSALLRINSGRYVRQENVGNECFVDLCPA